MTIHIFNPESDYALADFKTTYNPPQKVLKVRRICAFTQLALAEAGDAILLLDPAEDIISDAGKDYFESGILTAKERDVKILTTTQLADFIISNSRHIKDMKFSPWGWNPAIKHTLLRILDPLKKNYPDLYAAMEGKLPSEAQLSHIREISHRRFTIGFNKALNTSLRETGLDDSFISPIPVEFDNVEEAMKWERDNHPVFFKAPWSSSGRGILFTENISEEKISQWVSGIIRRQGSVMGETFADKVMDFATEWRISLDSEGKSHAEFLALSIFEASKNGKYIKNLTGDYSELLKIINTALPQFDYRVINAQKLALERALDSLCGDYQGYAGIDMLATKTGEMRGAIEVNFRTTMGIIARYDLSKFRI